MNTAMNNMRPLYLIAPSVLAVVLGACVSSTPAPVETRDTARKAPVSAASSSAAVLRPGYYVVKKGDTLYSIALENGHDYREVATWNGIENPSLITIGQELRVQAPEVVAPVVVGTTRPVALPRIESRPIDQSAPVAAQSSSAASVGGVVTEPRGGRIPYSDKAWKDLVALSQTPAVIQSAPLSAPQSAPQSAPKAAASAPVAEKPVVAAKPAASAPVAAPVIVVESAVKTGEDGVEWSWPSNGKLIGTFNDSSNKGIDIAGPMGDPVLAAASGKVIYAGADLRGYGNLVIIAHGAKFTTVYAHNKEILVKEQQAVQKGQKIAVMGDSDAERPKLHFEIRKQGKPADPLKFLPTR